jgi:toxin ParE1/3/4
MRVAFSASALADLMAIQDYIGEDNPHAASRVAIQLVAAGDRLEHLPERDGPVGAEAPAR